MVSALAWSLVILLVLAAIAYGALQIAISRNGPAVLDTVDRLTGSGDRAHRLATIRFGSHPSQKLVIQHQSDEAEGAALPVLVFFHGGSWKDGDPEDYGFIGRSFVPHGFVTVLAGYRLSEDGRFPAMLEDGAAGLAWVQANIAKHGGDPQHIILMGHSAGAYNAAMLALDGQWLEQHAVSASAIKGVVGLSGPYDFYPFDSDSTRAAFGHSQEPEATQPVSFAGPHAPPFLLVHGEADTTVKPRNSRELAGRLSKAGGRVALLTFSEMDHTAPLLRLASPWRRDSTIHDAIRNFAANPEASVPVQPESR